MSVDDASGETGTNSGGDGDAKFAPTFETSCYDRILDVSYDAAHNSDDQPEEDQSVALLRDAELVDRPHEAKTFWLHAGACPTTSLEKIAKAIFDFHTKNLRHHQHLHPHQDSHDTSLGSTPHSAAGKTKRWRDGRAPRGGVSPSAAPSPHAGCAESGAEWWVQRRQEGHHEDLGMPFHWDKDENMLDKEGVVLCPAVSTVTYLTDDGAPTVILESRAPHGGAVEEGDIERAFVSYPALFKHLAFDGGFLHGVPEQLMRTGHHHVRGKGEDSGQSGAEPGEGSTTNHGSSAASIPSSYAMRRPRRRGRMRVTLLVNVWLSHKPKGIAPLPARIAASLSSGGLGAPPSLCFDRPVAFSPVSVNKEKETLLRQEEAGVPSVGETGGSTMVIKAPLGPTLLLELRAPTPQRLSTGDLTALHSFALVYREGTFPRVSTWNKEKVGAVACVQGSKQSGGSRGDHSAERGGGRYRPVEGVTGAQADEAMGRTPRKRKHDMEA